MASRSSFNRASFEDTKDDILKEEFAVVERKYPMLSEEDSFFLSEYEEQKGKAVVRKIDYRLIPILALLYLLSHVDRANLGNAKIEGMTKDLHLVSNQYNIASTLFFVPYIIFEVPSNMVLKKVRPSIWLTFLILSWGLVMTLMSLVKDFGGLVACRMMLGLCEAGFFPGAVFIASSWYQRHELQQRIALFYTMSAFSGALGGLLAYAIANLNGVHGIAGWRWIFLIEGVITIGAGLTMYFLLVDNPERASWLSDEEKRFVNLRLIASGVRTVTGEGDKFSWRLFFETLTDWKILLGVLLDWVNCVPNTALGLELPQIIKDLGFTTAKAQLLTIPPYFVGGVSAFLAGRYADRFKWRFPFVVSPMIILAIAFGILYGFAGDIKDNIGVMYFAIMLAEMGIYPLLPGITSWTGNNIAPSWKRSIGLAWLLGAGNIGSIVGANVFLDSEKPRYPTGYGTSLGVICMGILAACVLEYSLWRVNCARAKHSEEDIRAQYSAEELDKMGDKSPLFKYTL